MIEGRYESQFVGRFERLPRNAIAGVKTYDIVRDTADPFLRKFADKDFVIANAAFFGLAGQDSDDRVYAPGNIKVQAPSMHRGFVARFGDFVDEYGVHYGHIGVKGTGVSARGLSAAVGYHPTGMFGVKHADQDEHVSSVFASYGGRTSRGVATIVIDNKKFLSWARRTSKINPFYSAEDELNIVKRNGDELCLYVRLLGAERRGEYNAASVPANDDRPFRADQIQTRALKTLMSEVRARGGSAFQEKYLVPDVVMGKIISASHFGGDPDEALLYLLTHMFNYNRGVAETVSEREFRNRLHFNLHNNNYDVLGFWVDWENALPESKQTIDAMPDAGYWFKHRVSREESEVLSSISLSAEVAGKLTAQRARKVRHDKRVSR